MNLGIDRILLGDNPFIGVNHLSQERTRESGIKFDSKKVARVINSALAAGAQGVVCSAHPNMRSALNQMREEGCQEHFGIYLIVPDAQSYVRTASEKGILGLLNETFGRLSLKGKTRAVVEGTFSALTSNPTKVMKTYLDADVSLFAKSIPSNVEVKSVILHELLTELIVSFRLKSLAKEYIDFVRDSLNAIPGFVTRNFARFAEFAASNDIPIRDIAILAPFNKVGFQMNPSRKLCEESLSKVPGSNVIAMSILASGFLGLQEAVDYLNQLDKSMSCVVGVSQEEHAQETFLYLRSHLR